MSIKKLTTRKVKTGGRNNTGRTTVFTIGGGHKQRYRLIDFKRELVGIPGQVQSIEYDPNRTAYIALVCYSIGVLSYIVATDGLKVGDWIVCSEERDLDYNLVKNGSVFLLKNLLVGDRVNNLELKPGGGSKILRSAGCSGIILNNDKEKNQVLIKLRSGEERLFSGDCKAVYGVVSNVNHRDKKLSKAGESRWRGRRPTVRGVAMNPVDHPHGGGEGKTSGGRPSVTPWGKLTKGKPTRGKKKNVLIVKRRK